MSSRCCVGLAARLVLSLAALGLSSAPAAGSELRKELNGFAKEIAQVAKDQGNTTLVVGEFTGPAGALSNSGPGIQQILIEELVARKVAVVPENGALEVKGEYVKVIDDESVKGKELIILRLEATIRKRKGGTKVKELQAEIRGNLDIAKLLAVTVSLPPQASRVDRNEKIRKAAEEPQSLPPQPAGTRIKSNSNSPYAIEVRVRKDGEKEGIARAARVEHGRAFVDLARGELYEVWLVNDSRHEAAAGLAIDGVDVFAFSEARKPDGSPKFRFHLVHPSKPAAFRGWFRSNHRVDSFKVTSFAESAAAKLLRSSAAVGTITVTFHLAWQGAEPPPPERGARYAGNATGFGPPIDPKLKDVKRTVGVLRDTITLRYNAPPAQ